MSQASDLIKIVIVDDHQMLLDGLQSLLGSSKDIKILNEALSGKDALQIIKKELVDVLVTDIQMSGMSGLELVRIVKQEYPNIKILILSMCCENIVITEAIKAGISGYILKSAGKNELIEAIHSVASGNYFYSEAVAQSVIKSQQNSIYKIFLTSREKEIVQLIAKEYSNLQIAQELFISERTVETHRKNIFRKTDTKSVVGLIKYAYEHKLI